MLCINIGIQKSSRIPNIYLYACLRPFGTAVTKRNKAKQLLQATPHLDYETGAETATTDLNMRFYFLMNETRKSLKSYSLSFELVLLQAGYVVAFFGKARETWEYCSTGLGVGSEKRDLRQTKRFRNTERRKMAVLRIS